MISVVIHQNFVDSHFHGNDPCKRKNSIDQQDHLLQGAINARYVQSRVNAIFNHAYLFKRNKHQ
jgi:hypothetical protein